MEKLNSMRCPVCESKLHIGRLSCTQCKAEYHIDREFFPFEYLSAEQKSFLITFLKCGGNIKAMEAELNVSYPTIKKRYEELLIALEIKEPSSFRKENIDMSIFGKINRDSKKASDVIKNKLYDNNGIAVINLPRGGVCHISIAESGDAFVSDKLPNQIVSFYVFDIIVDFLKSVGGKAPKGLGRSDRVGYGKCGEETVMYQIATRYYDKEIGESTFDPLFVLAAMLDWAGIAENGWGYLRLL
ncbi:MAG: DUF2089 family protein [Clostridia bacterium]|nr:DUF2089 family protein [Clostridia bacterium]